MECYYKMRTKEEIKNKITELQKELLTEVLQNPEMAKTSATWIICLVWVLQDESRK